MLMCDHCSLIFHLPSWYGPALLSTRMVILSQCSATTDRLCIHFLGACILASVHSFILVSCLCLVHPQVWESVDYLNFKLSSRPSSLIPSNNSCWTSVTWMWISKYFHTFVWWQLKQNVKQFSNIVHLWVQVVYMHPFCGVISIVFSVYLSFTVT